jgi:thiol-disulfide isomerase/thioredoxin
MTYTSGRRFEKAVLAAAGVAMSALLAACGVAVVDVTATPHAGINSEGTIGESGETSAGRELPNLAITIYHRLDELGDEEVTLSALVGQGKPIVLNFWAALCPPCRAEMPDFQAVYDERHDEVIIIGVDIGQQQHLGSREDGKQLLVDLGVTYPSGTTFDENVVRDFRMVGMPTTFFINTDGTLMRAWTGLLNKAKINELIDEMLES